MGIIQTGQARVVGDVVLQGWPRLVIEVVQEQNSLMIEKNVDGLPPDVSLDGGQMVLRFH